MAPLAQIGHLALQQLVPNIVEEEMGQPVGDGMILVQPIGGGEEPYEVVGGGMEHQEMEVVGAQGVPDGSTMEDLPFEMGHVDAREAQFQQLMEENHRLKEEARRASDTISAQQQRIRELEATMAKGKGACTLTTRPGTSTSPCGLVIGSMPDSLAFEHPDFNPVPVLGSPATPLNVIC